jgi:hypothetical protein
VRCLCGPYLRDDCGPAAYWWLTMAGNWIALCERCCAQWREFGRSDTSMAPVRITSTCPAGALVYHGGGTTVTAA